MESVFAHADRLFGPLGTFVRRPKKGELPEEVRERDGLPVISLVGKEGQDAFAAQIRGALKRATPRRIPHRFLDVQAIWELVSDERGACSLPEDERLDEDWLRTELCRRVLVDLAKEFSSVRNGCDQRVRFRRFGLVNWLLEMTDTNQEPNSGHAEDVLRRLRDREIQRRPMFWFMRNPGTEVALQGQVPWWVYLFGLHVLPLVWFRGWRVLGSEYRWLLRQPYMAPGDPGSFEGFATRLTQARWGEEDPVQVRKLMINAFLEDLRVAYRRRPWRRRAHRRMAYTVAFLGGVSDDNGGWPLLRSLTEVRDDTGAFDPLLLITGSAETDGEDASVRDLSTIEGEDLYASWCEQLRVAKHTRDADFWFLHVEVPEILEATVPDSPGHRKGRQTLDFQRQRNSATGHFRVHPVPVWAGRLATVTAAVLALTLLAGVAGYAISAVRDWEERHCGLSRSDPDAETLERQVTGECVGVAPHGFAFGSGDRKLRRTLDVIARQNAEAERIHRAMPERPVVTLVHLSALLSSPTGQEVGSLAYAREQLQGAASAQRRQSDLRDDAPVVRILPANAGSGMRFGSVVVRTIERMARTDATIVGVTGLDQSRKATIATIDELTRIGLPMVATTLSADTLDDHSPLYYQVSPQNRREAEVSAAYADHLVDEGRLRRRAVRILHSADPTDEYSANLRADAAESFADRGFAVEEQDYAPSPHAPGTPSSAPGAHKVGEDTCRYTGLVFFAGRAEDFETILSAANANCGFTPPYFLAGDDVALLGADADRRGDFARIPYEFLDFTLGSTSCDAASDLYGTIKELFPEECRKVEDTSLDGHAALAFDAVNLYLKAIGRLRDTESRMPLTASAVWLALSRIHGDAALDGESGRIDFGGVVDGQIPLDKLLSVQRVHGVKRPTQVGFCGRVGMRPQAAWCPPPEGAP
ncbi:ABC transporter substrate-binding protein [Streptomyces scabiei]|uniref:ABC transporter substrate-binding protein n=2 Tax=Streptomyces TaxID=1883 RepID=UPI0006897A64|nr:ABC transporter substrate-binding protein [Streptomyces scabiei]